ncbi:integrin alpha-8 isoform X2 [Orussus abietinus]|uniref:integrin alpha-8 isoform X2 n=1 Tax=Orussus abietinus TaxID=222816 RepID=UPI000C716339|nr:integrin alpha-8 isoform X2 [Orussus abietinus]
MFSVNMFIKILHFFPALVLGYNLDVKSAVLFKSPENNSYFGYTVVLYTADPQNSWLIVGAPRANDTVHSVANPGIVYRCLLFQGCLEVSQQYHGTEYGKISQIRYNTVIEKENAWFGAAISIQKHLGLITACAPRTIMTLKNNGYHAPVDFVQDTMHGFCYTGSILSLLQIEDKYTSIYNFRDRNWGNPIHGFSVAYASTKHFAGENQRIIGRPKHKTWGSVEITHANNWKESVELPNSDEQTQFGYSVTSGFFFNKSQVLFASGAPGWAYVGQVSVIDPSSKTKIIATLVGTEVGGFFGASLAAGDLNGDGLDDLVIGSPHSGEDSGRVFIYLGSSTHEFVKVDTELTNGLQGAQFGYSLACGDLDQDGFADVIVGAPWEKNGAVYVFNGHPNIQEGLGLGQSQRIQTTNSIKTFGFSLSEPEDIDNNGYPDLAVGAYSSNHAVVIRGKPVINVNITIEIYPEALQANHVNVFFCIICIKYYGKHAPTVQYFDLNITIDEDYKRTREETVLLPNVSVTGEVRSCINQSIPLSDNIRNVVDPVKIIVRHKLSANQSLDEKACSIEKKDSASEAVEVELPFDIDCGEDKICYSNVSLAIKFHGVRNDSVWIIGSGDIAIVLNLTNSGEPAYLTVVTIFIPEGISLLSVLPFCQEDISNSTVSVSCEIGNPFDTSTEKIIKLDLDMKLMNHGFFDGKTLTFRAIVKTQNINQGSKETSAPLNLKAEASLIMTGKPTDEFYLFSTSKEGYLTINFEQVYQISKFGATSISGIDLVVSVPLGLEGSEVLVLLSKPNFYISGRRHECHSEDITFFDAHLNGRFRDLLDNSEFTINDTTRKKRATLEENAGSEETDFAGPEMKEPHVPNFTGLQVTDDTLRKVISLNCSAPGLKCGKLTCELGSLKTPDDVVHLLLNFILHVTSSKDSSEVQKIIYFSTEARINSVQPYIFRLTSPNRFKAQVTTTFYVVPNIQKVEPWILLVSIALGIILLSVITGILSWLGFFRRYKKEQLNTLKTSDASEMESPSQLMNADIDEMESD